MKFNEFQENPYHPWAIRDPVAPSCNTTNNTSHYDNIKPNASIHNITSLMNQFTGNTVTSAPLSQPLLATSEIALPFRAIFPFAYFNAVQSLCLDKIYYSDKSTVVCSPTGSGKTVLLELAILRLLQSFQLSGASNYNLMKVLYIAPIKALCSEKANDWHAKFSKFGITVGELTGDSAVNEQAFLMKTHIMYSLLNILYM